MVGPPALLGTPKAHTGAAWISLNPYCEAQVFNGKKKWKVAKNILRNLAFFGGGWGEVLGVLNKGLNSLENLAPEG